MDTIVNVLKNVIGEAPDYFTIGNSSTPQWDYGALLEYAFAGVLLILSLAFVYKLFIALANKH